MITIQTIWRKTLCILTQLQVYIVMKMQNHNEQIINNNNHDDDDKVVLVILFQFLISQLNLQIDVYKMPEDLNWIQNFLFQVK